MSLVRKALSLLIMLTLCLGGGLVAAAGEHGAKMPAKKALLLVSFGTSVPEAQKVFQTVEAAFKKAFPDVELRWAYTSRIIREKLKAQGQEWLSPEEALGRLMAQGYKQVVVQSLHVIPGAEFHDLMAVAQGFGHMDPHFKVRVGYPLCSTTEDLQLAVKAVMADLPKERKRDEAVVLMGHGTHHPGGVVYPALAYMFAKADPLVLMGTVEGCPSLEDVLVQLRAKGVKKAYLLPFMTVAGDHAMNDMAGDEPQSWKGLMAKEGIQAVPVLRAITENPAVVNLFVRHAQEAMEHFK